MPSNVKVSASWKTVSALYTRVGGSWKNVTEGYTKIGGAWKAFFTSVTPLTVNYLVIAGGGGGGSDQGGGAGAGGFRTSAGTSGGGASAESALTLAVATSYTVTVGAGGTGMSASSGSTGSSGSNSVFGTITSTGGGRGGSGGTNNAQTGGSGGGGGAQVVAGSGAAGTANQGFAGGGGSGTFANAGGGGGAAEVGNTDGQREGGDGVASTISGSSVTYAGGGAGGAANGTNVTGGTGGGGTGTGGNTTGGAGTANTGGGGGGGGSTPGVGNGAGGAGGSGIVILKYPSNYAINPSPGLSHRTVTSAGFNITTFTAGTGTVSFAAATTSSYELIQTVYLTASQSSVTFDVSGLGSEYQHLQIRAVGRTDRSGADSDPLILRFNSDTGNNYATHGLGAYNYNGSGATYSNATTSTSRILLTESLASSVSTANAFGVVVADIADPFETTKNKTVKAVSGLQGGLWRDVSLRSGVWLNTGAVTSITLAPLVGSNFVANSRFSIYGLKGS